MKERRVNMWLLAAAVLSILFWIGLAFFCAVVIGAGEQCSFSSDCGVNEVCRTVPFDQRDGGSAQGICVPKGW